ncbi:uncharacterized protein LY89DRAFT_781113 [Mollisia scopiformis]|uniref:Uncharacterized protein n=1 Tax=Mollisia scopiformis TaxID=149040 RepID=A0A194XCV6_MOLSC|nr:uncharacterized protein LY89DRAFT_781113 [Mollisia scopiformis]KUJ18003.1 hypothetical protein LY89DRAFT_781113 [Mollisia scopiformis]
MAISDYHTWIGLELTTTFDASAVRNVVTTLFLILNFLIAFTGERLIMRHGQRKLLNKKTVRVTDLSPFLPVISVLKTSWALKRLPGGLFGLLMIASGLFGLSGRFLVNSFIDGELVALNCTFTEGVVTTERIGSSPGYFTPSAAWAATALVRRAQQAAAENSYTAPNGTCSTGVYSKVHNNVTIFCPTDQDVLGNWNCVAHPPSIVTPLDRTNDSTISNFASSSTFLYSAQQNEAGRQGPDGGYSDLMAWSANDTLTSLSTLSIRISMAAGLDATQSVNTSNYQCELDITNPTWSPSGIDTSWVIKEWADTMLGSLLDMDPYYYSFEMSLVLNAVTMVSGSANSLSWQLSDAIDSGAGSTFGCMDYRTVAHPQVFAIILVLILITVVLGAVNLLEMLWNRKSEFQKVVGSLPISLLEWQLALTKKMVNDDAVQERDLKACVYEFDERERVVKCTRAENVGKKRAKVYEKVEMVNGDKIEEKNGNSCTYVWNAEYKTVECRKRSSDEAVTSYSDLSIPKRNTIVTSTPM